ncbi:MAG TPA: DegT/DnrJ/EryC1/StrS family aminotransferase [Candidatus Elarobacter sp.]
MRRIDGEAAWGSLPADEAAPSEAGGAGRDGVRYVNFQRISDLYRDELHAVVERVLGSGVYAGGPEVADFESAFAAFCGTRFTIAVGSGLDALALTLRAWNVGAGDDVVVPANTAVQTALAVSHAGARVVLADVDPESGLLTAETLRTAMTPATRVVIPVHLYGQPADVDALRAVADAAGARVLEDAAHAHGATYRGRRCGSLADAAAFSFYPTKNLGAFGDGGCVTTDDAALAGELRLLRTAGLTTAYRHERKGFTSRLDPLQAALLGWKLNRLDAWNERRREIARTYAAALSGTPGLRLLAPSADTVPVWYAFPVLVADGLRDALERALLENGIETNVHYRLPVHLQPCYADSGWARGDFPHAEARADAQLSLPLDPFHATDEIARVAAAVRRALSRLRASRETVFA